MKFEESVLFLPVAPSNAFVIRFTCSDNGCKWKTDEPGLHSKHESEKISKLHDECPKCGEDLDKEEIDVGKGPNRFDLWPGPTVKKWSPEGEGCYTYSEKEDLDWKRWGVVDVEGDKRLLIIDADLYKMDEGDKNNLKTPKTERVHESQNGGLHFFYLVDENDLDGGKLPVKLRKHIDDKLNGYTLWPSCDGYKVVKGGEPSKIDPATDLDDSLLKDGGKKETEVNRTVDIDDEDIKERLELAKNRDEKFKDLFEGNHEEVGFKDDRSGAEASLAAKIGFWFGRDPDVIEKVMGMSKSPKWHERDDRSYRDSIIESGMQGDEVYEPKKNEKTWRIGDVVVRVESLDNGWMFYFEDENGQPVGRRLEVPQDGLTDHYQSKVRTRLQESHKNKPELLPGGDDFESSFINLITQMQDNLPGGGGESSSRDGFIDGIDRALEEASSVEVHPAIDFSQSLGMSFGTSEKEDYFPVSSDADNEKALVSSKTAIVGEKESIQSLTDFSDDEIVLSESDNLSIGRIYRLQVLKSIKSVCKDGEMENEDGEMGRKEFFNLLLDKVSHYWYHQDSRYYPVVASWIYGTYFFPLFDCYPPLGPQGQRKTGKTTLVRVIQNFSWNSTDIQSNLRPAPTYRRIEDSRPTFIIDITQMNEKMKYEITDLIEHGMEKGGSVPRCIGDENEVREFRVFSPKVIASREDLPFDPKVIKITTTKPPSRKKMNKLSNRRRQLVEGDPDREDIISTAMSMALKYWPDVKEAYENEEQSEDLYGRRFRLWRPLLAVCRALAPKEKYEEVRRLAEEEDIEVIDETHMVESALLSVLIDKIDKDTEKLEVKLTGDESLTDLVSREMGEGVNYQKVHSAMKNLNLMKKKVKGASKTTYHLDVDRIKKRAKDRDMISRESDLGGREMSHSYKVNTLIDIVENLGSKDVPIKDVKSKAKAENISPDFVEEWVDNMEEKGEIIKNGDEISLNSVQTSL